MRTVIEYVDVPCLIDADGLNLLSDNKDLLDRLADRKFIFTPHMKEMSRLTGISVEDLREDRIQILKKFADGYQVTCVLKDSRTLIADKANEICLNLTGNSAMGKSRFGRCAGRCDRRLYGAGKRYEKSSQIRYICTWFGR